MTTKNTTEGITHWAEKKRALCDLFGRWSDTELAIEILGKPQGATSENDTVESLSGSFKSWFKSKPNGSTGVLFLNELTKRLIEKNPSLQTNGDAYVRNIIRNGQYKDFLHLLPENIQNILSSPAEMENKLFYPHWVKHGNHLDSIQAALTNGKIDQKFHYLNPDAAEIWRDVVNSGVYKQYEECRYTIIELCDSASTWWEFVNTGDTDGAIMLGCGSGTKDMQIIQSMLSLSTLNKVNYALVDYSPYMARSAFHHVRNTLQLKEVLPRVNLTIHEVDFVNNFAVVGKQLTRQGKNVAWFLPGGTIGNLDEEKLFKSIYSESQANDLFIIGADSVDLQNSQSDEEIRTQYDTPEVRRFVEMPLRSALRESGINELPAIKVNVVRGNKNKHSKVNGATTVVVSSIVNGKELILLTSTRYDESELVKFAVKHGFTKETIITSTIFTKRYKQFIFRRN